MMSYIYWIWKVYFRNGKFKNKIFLGIVCLILGLKVFDEVDRK